MRFHTRPGPGVREGIERLECARAHGSAKRSLVATGCVAGDFEADETKLTEITKVGSLFGFGSRVDGAALARTF